jgi:hypothetical protein
MFSLNPLPFSRFSIFGLFFFPKCQIRGDWSADGRFETIGLDYCHSKYLASQNYDFKHSSRKIVIHVVGTLISIGHNTSFLLFNFFTHFFGTGKDQSALERISRACASDGMSKRRSLLAGGVSQEQY